MPPTVKTANGLCEHCDADCPPGQKEICRSGMLGILGIEESTEPSKGISSYIKAR